MFLRLSCFTSVLTLLVCCCPPGPDPCAVDFDQTALLTNVADNIISPAYADLQESVNTLQSLTEDFCSAPSLNRLDSLQNQWKNTALNWQKAMIYEFGPADNYRLRAEMNNFPVFVTRLESAIQSGVYNLEIDSFSYARGIPALDYLLFGVAADNNSIVTAYDTDLLAANRKQYLQDVVAQLKQKVDWTVSDWDSYQLTFKSTTGLATGSPMSLLVNQLNQNYELFKNNKLGTPVGAKVSYIPAPERAEAYYSRYSLELAVASLEAMKTLFEGQGGVGLDDYLAVVNIDKDGQPLQDLIISQFTIIKSALQALAPNSLVDNINNNFEAVKAAYGYSQNQVIYLKTDLPSVLCINITYVDNTDDGD